MCRCVIGIERLCICPHTHTEGHSTWTYTKTTIAANNLLTHFPQAVTITAGEEVITRDIPQGEMRFYRFVLPDRDRNSSLVTVRLVPLLSAAGTASDPDLHISNKYAGLVAVDRDNYIWRSTNIGLDQVLCGFGMFGGGRH